MFLFSDSWTLFTKICKHKSNTFQRKWSIIVHFNMLKSDIRALIHQKHIKYICVDYFSERGNAMIITAVSFTKSKNSHNSKENPIVVQIVVLVLPSFSLFIFFLMGAVTVKNDHQLKFVICSPERSNSLSVFCCLRCMLPPLLCLADPMPKVISMPWWHSTWIECV